jgi:peptidoglycan hydrolase CwlO-like protein
MKIKLTLLLLGLVPFFGINAQKPVIVSEDSLKIGSSLIPGLSVTIPEADYDKTLKAWIRDLQAGTKSKVKNENGEIQILGAKIRSISKDAISIYSKLERLDSILILYASFEISKDQYVTSTTVEPDFSKVQNFMKDFAKNQYIEVAKAQADAEEKKLKDLQRELSSLENEKSRMQKGIQNDNSSIASERENIAIQTNEMNTVSAAIVEETGLLASMEEGPAKKEKEAQIKELEKRKKKAQNSIESSEKKISKADSDINKATGDIPRNERIQEKVKEQIVAQEAVYQKYADKLKKIRSY